MKPSQLNHFLKPTLQAVPLAALMLGAAEAGTTVGINFSGDIYGYFAGVPVTAAAFGVGVSDWSSTPISWGGTGYDYAAKSGSMTVAAMGVSWNATNTWLSVGWAPPTPVPGDAEVTYGMLDNTGWNFALSNLTAAFPGGYVVELIGAGKTTANSSVVVTENTGNTVVSTITFALLPNSNGLGTSPVLNYDSITLTNDSRDVSNKNCALGGFIITDKPVIVQNPVGAFVADGGTVSLTAGAIGLPGLNYQWKLGGSDIGTNSATYTKTGATSADSGDYTVVVTNSAGEVTSATATVTVAAPLALTWVGASSPNSTYWDLDITANWTGDATKFTTGSIVTFNDSAASASPVTVAMQGLLTPTAVTFTNSSKAYTVTGGAGQGLIGTTGITKNGSNSLTLGGAGSTFTGPVNITNGVLELGNGEALGYNSGITIAAGARLNFNGHAPANQGRAYSYTIAGTGGDGAGGVGAITTTGGDIYASAGIRSLTLTDHAEIGGNNGRFDVGRAETGGGLYGTINGGGFTLTKVGSNSMVFRAPASDITYVVNAGRLSFEDYDSASGTQPITVNGTASLGTYGLRSIANDVTLNAGTTLVNVGGDTGTWNGTVTAAGNITLQVDNNLVLAGALAGAGNINRTGGWTLVLQNSAAAYSGKITNNAGTLRIASNAALGSATGTDVLTLGNCTLQGGTIAGLASATIGSASQGITQSNSVTYDAGAGNTLSIDGAVTGNGTLYKGNNSGALVFNKDVTITGYASSNGGTQTFNGNLVLGTGSSFQVGSDIVTNLNCPVLTAPDGMDFWRGTTHIAIGLGTVDDMEVQQGGGEKHTIYHTAGTLNVTHDIRIGHWSNATASDFSTYNLSGGTINQPDTVTNPWDEGQANLMLGIDGTGVLNQSGGTINTTSMVLDARGDTAGDDTYRMTGGRFNLGKWGIRSGNTGTSKLIELGGGIVGASADWSSAIKMTLTGTNGNVIFDTLDSVDATSARTITLTGALSGLGGLTKQGTGSLVLDNAAGSFSGTALVEGGALFVNSGAAATAPLKVATGGTLQVGTVATVGTATAAALDLAGGTAAFRIGTATDLLTVPSFTVSAASSISVIPGNALTPGSSYTLIDYSGTVGGLGVAAGLTLTSANPHLKGTLADDTTNSLLKVNIDVADSIIWGGNLDGSWNVDGTPNWLLASDGVTQSNFYNFDVVKFDNSGLGRPTVTLSGTVDPATLAVENTYGNYTFQGSGLIGVTGLAKSGAGALTLLNDNTNTGAVSITNGLVTVGNGTTAGTLGGSGNITLNAGATLVFNRSDAQALTRTVVGTGGTLVKDGTNTLTMSAPNNTCDITVNNGTLAARGGDWGTSFAANRTITVNAPGILDTTTHALNGLGGGARPNYIVLNEDAVWKLNNEQQLPNTALTMHAGIINGPGDVRGGGTVMTLAHPGKSSVINAPMSTGNGAITFNVANGDVATDLAVTGNIGGGNGITKSGTGTLVLSGTANSYGGNTAVNAGTLSIGTDYLANGANVLVTTGAVLDLTTGTTDVINELLVDGIVQPKGVYGAVLSGAQFERSYITGTGTLTVTTDSYSQFETANGIVGAGAGADSDTDGIPNGIEFVIGGDPSGPDSNSNALLPTNTLDATYLNFVFRRTTASVGFNPSVEYGSTLSGWTMAQNGVDGVIVSVVPNGFGAGIDSVTVKIPRTLAAPGTKLFARLHVVIP